MNIFDALYSLCKSHCKLKQSAWFLSISYLFPFLHRKENCICVWIYNHNESKGHKCFTCLRVAICLEISMGKTFRPLGSGFGQTSGDIGSVSEIWTAAAESNRTEIMFDETETLCVSKTISEDGAASWISGYGFGCVRVDFCMRRIHCTSIRRSILPLPGSVFPKVVMQVKIFKCVITGNTWNRVCVYIYGSPLCHLVGVLIKCLPDSFKYMTTWLKCKAVMAEQSWSL